MHKEKELAKSWRVTFLLPFHCSIPRHLQQAELDAPSSRQPGGSAGDGGRENKHFQWDREQNWGCVRCLRERQTDR